MKPSNTFEFTYHLELFSDIAPGIELPITVHCYYSPEDPSVGFTYPSILIESVEVPGLSDAENEQFWREISAEFAEELDRAAWEYLEDLRIQADCDYYEDRRQARLHLCYPTPAFLRRQAG